MGLGHLGYGHLGLFGVSFGFNGFEPIGLQVLWFWARHGQEWPGMASNGPEWLGIIRNDPTWPEKVPNWLKMARNGMKWPRMA